MKLAEILCAVLCLSLFSSSAGAAFVSLSRLYVRSSSVRKAAERDFFMAESFRHTCHGNGFKDLAEWKKNCSALCRVDDLEYGIYKSEAEKKLLYCKWESVNGEIMVLDFSREKKLSTD